MAQKKFPRWDGEKDGEWYTMKESLYVYFILYVYSLCRWYHTVLFKYSLYNVDVYIYITSLNLSS